MVQTLWMNGSPPLNIDLVGAVWDGRKRVGHVTQNQVLGPRLYLRGCFQDYLTQASEADVTRVMSGP